MGAPGRVGPISYSELKPEPSREGNRDQIMPDTKRLLKASEVAEMLQLSRSKAYQLMQQGEIPTVRMGRTVRVKRSDLEEYIKQSKEK
jgi:excisionase family DNA binding protein